MFRIKCNKNACGMHGYKIGHILCCPVFIPQIVGDPLLPGAERTNESVAQSPIEPPMFF